MPIDEPVSFEVPAASKVVDPAALVGVVINLIQTAPNAMTACSWIKAEVDRWSFGSAPIPR